MSVSRASLSLVGFWLGLQRYGLAVEAVCEVVRLPALTLLAGAAPELAGLLNLRGQYLPVLDGRVLLGEPSAHDLSNQIMIIGDPEPALGLLVDQVDQIMQVAPSDCTPLTTGMATPLLTHVLTIADGSFLVLNPVELLRFADQMRLPTHIAAW